MSCDLEDGEPIVSRRPDGDSGLATWQRGAKAICLFAGAPASAILPHFMAVVRGRSPGLPVPRSGSPTCVQLPPFRLATIRW